MVRMKIIEGLFHDGSGWWADRLAHRVWNKKPVQAKTLQRLFFSWQGWPLNFCLNEKFYDPFIGSGDDVTTSERTNIEEENFIITVDDKAKFNKASLKYGKKILSFVVATMTEKRATRNMFPHTLNAHITVQWFQTKQFPFQCLLSFQYSLLQTVVETCQKKRRCRFLSSPKTFGGDPCPGHRKFIEVAYKCRPSKFYDCNKNSNEALPLCMVSTRLFMIATLLPIRMCFDSMKSF